MSYVVLARKWRPKRFAEMVGQEHVLRALSNALDSGKVHHAFLFTGTRGVGKTTVARILAKSLNCETNGVSSNPCGICAACREIDEGRFVDLIEVKHGRAKVQRESAKLRLKVRKGEPQFRNISSKEFTLLSKWYYAAVLELLSTGLKFDEKVFSNK